MGYQLESIEVRVREMPPDRLSFAIGKSGAEGKEGGGAAKRRPEAVLLVRVEVSSVEGGGKSAVGFSGDRPSFGWLDKRPGRTPDEKLTLLLDLVEAAREQYLAQGRRFESPFALWRAAGEAVGEKAAAMGAEDLMASYASALYERAVIDAVCRLEGASFFEMVRGDRLGIVPEVVHPELEGVSFSSCFPRSPRTSFHIRHTVGLSDPIDAADWPDEKRIDDGEPETLAEYARRDGLRYFKIKISGHADRDLERLEAIWERVLLDVDEPVITLDGNEAYADLEAFAAFERRFERELPGLYQHTLFIEQPLTRRLTHDPDTAEWVRRIGERKPLVIDEADGRIDAFKDAFALGYAGCSHKNCKGVFKSLLNRALCRHFTETTDREAFLSGEDLSNMTIVPLHQDFAALSVLDLSHCERNGHHYAYGLSHLTEDEKGRIAEHHPDLYVERDGEWFLRIEGGKVRAASLQGPGFGTIIRPDWEVMTPLREWRRREEVAG